jgi:hypothetical protein
VALAIIVISFIPPVVTAVRARKARPKEDPAA